MKRQTNWIVGVSDGKVHEYKIGDVTYFVSAEFERSSQTNLRDRVQRTVVSYLRHLVNGLVPQDAPPPDYYAMMRELHGIGNNLNQIAVKAHTLNVLDVQRYDEACRKIDMAIKKITEAAILPRPMK